MGVGKFLIKASGSAAGVAYAYAYWTHPKSVPTSLYNLEATPATDRHHNKHRARTETFDVAIIGGGAVGSAAMLECARRGMSAVLIERDDFSCGTSSRSTKLIHGGVRYLRDAVFNVDFGMLKLVYQGLRERSHLIHMCPYSAHPVGLVMPSYDAWSKWQTFAGVKMYDVMAYFGTLGKTRVPTSTLLTPEACLHYFPLLKKDGLNGGILYYDGQHNDSRVNTMMVLTSTLKDYLPSWTGGVALNHTEATGFTRAEADGSISGIAVRDTLTKEEYTIKSKAVLNAAGIFADSIRHMADPSLPDLISPAAGAHIVVPGSYSSKNYGLVIPKTTDGRVLFCLPWEGVTILGTTDHASPITEKPKASLEDISFIVNEALKYLDVKKETVCHDILSTWSGIRPLIKTEIMTGHATNPSGTSGATSAVKRDHFVEVGSGPASGMYTVVGGKWTTVREMAEDAIATLKSGSLKHTASNPHLTWDLRVWGSFMRSGTSVEVVNPDKLALELAHEYNLPSDVSEHLARNYGFNARRLCASGRQSKQLTRITPDRPFVLAEVSYAARHELAETVRDVIAYRMRMAFVDPEGTLKALPAIASTMAAAKGWTPIETEAQLDDAAAFLEYFKV